MTNLEKYNRAFEQALELQGDLINDNLRYAEVSEWDSVGHMNLIEHLEKEFDIQFDMDDMLAINSYKEGKAILKKYNIAI